MSRIDDILTGARAAIKNNATFAAAEILMRKELKADSGPYESECIFEYRKSKTGRWTVDLRYESLST